MDTVRIGLLRKQPDWSHAAFVEHWRTHHGPLAAKLAGLMEYVQNPVYERMQRGITFVRGPWDFDGFSQLRFAAGQTLTDDDAIAPLLAEDEAMFLSDLHIVTAQTSVVIPVANQGQGLCKRISLLRRRDDVSETHFRREWRVHADLVRAMPGVAGYRQNVITARERVKGQACDYARLPIDGIVELWFENTDTLQTAFSSPAGQKTMAHAQTFLGDITVFGVDAHVVVDRSG